VRCHAGSGLPASPRCWLLIPVLGDKDYFRQINAAAIDERVRIGEHYGIRVVLE
jgi:hypothetical protein